MISPQCPEFEGAKIEGRGIMMPGYHQIPKFSARWYLLYLFPVLILSIWQPALVCGQKAFDEQSSGVSFPQRKAVHLYFADTQMRFLTAEQRELVCALDDVSLGRCILTALIEGPRRRETKVIPSGTELNAFYVTEEGTAYVDFNDVLSRNHPGGTRSELLTIFAIVNSLTLNLAKVNRVQILIDGRQQETLAGHVAISDYFKANILLIR